MSSSWNSVGLEVLYQVIGWIAFAAWSFSFYPQVVLNYRRKSVVGLNFDFLVLNLTKHSSYLIYNTALFFSPVIQTQYHEKFGDKEVLMTAIKYIPQAVMNFRRKSTVGWSIGNILLDLTGGVLNFGQMGVQSVDQHTLVNFYGNIGKTLLSLEVVFFDVIFIIQHYVLYPVKRDENGKAIISERVAPLVRPLDKPEEDSV